MWRNWNTHASVIKMLSLKHCEKSLQFPPKVKRVKLHINFSHRYVLKKMKISTKKNTST